MVVNDLILVLIVILCHVLSIQYRSDKRCQNSSINVISLFTMENEVIDQKISIAKLGIWTYPFIVCI